MKIVITNVVSLNGGDAAILAAEHRLLASAFPGASIAVVDSQAAAAARWHPEFRFEQHLYEGSRHQWFAPARRRAIRSAAARLARGETPGCSALVSRVARRTLETYASADLIVSTGGTYFVEHYELTTRVFELELACSFSTPLVFFTQSLGPFRRSDNRAAMRHLFERATLVLLRDERSREHLLEIGIPAAPLHVHGDCAFALGADSGLQRLRSGRLPARGARVSISVRDWTHFPTSGAEEGMRRYRTAVAGAVDYLVKERGAQVTFVSTCQGIPEYWTNDARTAREIVRLLPADIRPRVEVDDGFHRTEELIALLGESDLVIATRMHAAILALAGGTPVLPIAYESKTIEMFNALSFGDFVLAMEDITAESAVEACRRVFDELDSRRAALADGVIEQRRSAWSVVDRLRGLVLPTRSSSCVTE